jgi:transposase-like protein
MPRRIICPNKQCRSVSIKRLSEKGVSPSEYLCAECGKTFQKTARKKSEPSTPEQIAAKKFKRYAKSLGLSPSLLGASVIFDRKEFRIVGLNTMNRKQPIIVRSKDGNSGGLCSVLAIKKRLGLPIPARKSIAQEAAETLDKFGAEYGLSPSLKGYEFSAAGRRLHFIGLKKQNWKSPVVILDIESRKYCKCSVDYFLKIMATAGSTPPGV